MMWEPSWMVIASITTLHCDLSLRRYQHILRNNKMLTS